MSKIGEYRFEYVPRTPDYSGVQKSGHLVVLRDWLDEQIAESLGYQPVELSLRAVRSNNHPVVRYAFGLDYDPESGEIIPFGSRADALHSSDEINLRRNKLKY